MFHASGTEVAEQLRDMFGCCGACGLEFEYENSFDHHIGGKFTQERAVLILHCEWQLLVNAQPLLAQAMDQRVFVDAFQMAGTEKAVNGKSGFAYKITELKRAVFWFHCWGFNSNLKVLIAAERTQYTQIMG